MIDAAALDILLHNRRIGTLARLDGDRLALTAKEFDLLAVLAVEAIGCLHRRRRVHGERRLAEGVQRRAPAAFGRTRDRDCFVSRV